MNIKLLYYIFAKEFKSLILSPLAWSIMAVLQWIISFQFLSHIEKYLAIQQQQGLTSNVTDMIIVPIYGAISITLLLITPILTMRQISGEYKNNTMSLLLSSPVPASIIVLGKYLAVCCFLYSCVLFLSLMPLSLIWTAAIDLGQIASAIMGVVLCISAFVALGLYLSSLTRHPSVAAISSLGILLFLWLINWAASSGEFSLLAYLSLLYHLKDFIMGSITTEHISFFILFSIYFLVLSIEKLKIMSYLRVWKKWLLKLLFSSLIILFAILSFHYNLVFDWTNNQKNSLSPATVAMLKTIKLPIAIRSYTANNSIKSQIQTLIKPYQYHHSQIQLSFIDPAKQPEAVRKLGIQVDGELVISLADRTEHLTEISEEKLSNALVKLSRQSLKTVYFISGHGERSYLRKANFDLSSLATILTKQGFIIKEANVLDLSKQIKSKDMLVLAGPTSQFFEGEVDVVIDLLDKGSNFLWLVDPQVENSTNEDLYGLEVLAEFFGIEFADGIIVDPQTQSLKLERPDFAIISDYIASHPISSKLQQTSLFPQALAIDPLAENNDYKFTPFLLSSEQTWLESSAMQGTVRYDEDTDIAGPLILGVTLQRNIEKEISKESEEDDKDRFYQQRIVVVGDGDFISNRYLANGGNMALGINIFNWLSEDEQLLSIAAKFYADQRIELSQTQLLSLGFGFFIALPVLFLVIGWFIRYKRRS
jgi:gliding motility-associatede transport system auxiliary component